MLVFEELKGEDHSLCCFACSGCFHERCPLIPRIAEFDLSPDATTFGSIALAFGESCTVLVTLLALLTCGPPCSRLQRGRATRLLRCLC